MWKCWSWQESTDGLDGLPQKTSFTSPAPLSHVLPEYVRRDHSSIFNLKSSMNNDLTMMDFGTTTTFTNAQPSPLNECRSVHCRTRVVWPQPKIAHVFSSGEWYRSLTHGNLPALIWDPINSSLFSSSWDLRLSNVWPKQEQHDDIGNMPMPALLYTKNEKNSCKPRH